MAVLALKDLKIGYDSTKSISVPDTNFSLGETVGLLGRNGRGKTTLLKTLHGQIKPLTGLIEFQNQNIPKLPLEKLAGLISYADANSHFAAFQSIFDYVAVGSYKMLNFWGHLEEDQKTRIQKILSAFEIQSIQGQFMSESSAGQRQMAQIAKMITQDSIIYLWDEITSNLDFYNKSLFYSYISTFNQDKSKIHFMSGHDLELLYEHCQSFFIFQNEALLFLKKEELTSVENLKKLMF